jgi:hypothetical protein
MDTTDLRRASIMLAICLALLATQILRGIEVAAEPLTPTDQWDQTDKVLATVTLTATLLDWGQTRYIAKHPQPDPNRDPYHEKNPILGKHPSTAKVDRYFVGAIAIGGLIAHHLPSRQRKYFLGGVAVVEICVAARNRSIGIGFSF